MKESGYIFDWGEAVQVSEDAPKKYHPGKMASVCGFRAIETPDQVAAFGFPLGTIICLIEFSDGSAIEIPETHLKGLL